MKKTNEQGFTFIEVLLTMAIISFLGAAIFGLQYIISETQIQVWRNALSVEEANSNISIMVKEIRNARPSDAGAYALVRALDNEFVFYSDIDRDDETEKVRYTLSGSSLIKGVTEPVGYPAAYPEDQEKVKPIANYVRNTTPIFYYYNGDWPADTANNPLDTPTRLSDTKLMKVYLEINPDEDKPENNFILESYVQLRTLKDNL